MEPDDLFDGFRPEEYESETQERWGTTGAYRESQRSTARYGEKEWAAVQEEGGDIARRFGELLRAGAVPHSPEATALAEEHRLHIGHWFYPCTPEMHANLGEMYVADARFAAFWDAFEAGLAVFVRDAIVANAGR